MDVKKFFALLLSLVMALSLMACGTQPASDATEPSGTGSNVTESSQAEPVVLDHVVIFNSSLCAVLEAFGKTDAIVGAYGTLAETYGVPSCGKWNEVDVESVIATGANAVFCFEKYTTREQIDILKEAGVTCYFIELSNADTAAEEVMQLGELFGCKEKAQVFAELYNTCDALLEERLATVAEPLKVYVEGTAKEPFKTANNTTAAHALVEGAGLVNVYADNETAYPERNLEAVITADPDVIVKLCTAGVDPQESYAEYATGLSGVAAADAGRVILLNDQVGTTAIGSVIGRLYIAKFSYPELFSDVDVDAAYGELCTSFLGMAFTGSGAFAG